MLELVLQAYPLLRPSERLGTRATSTSSLRKTVYPKVFLDIPYDRSLLSKGLGPNAPKPIRNEQSLENNGIIVLKQSTVTNIDYAKKSVAIEGKDALSYDKLLIASGVKNRVPPISGLTNTKFYSLRNKQDYLNIH